MAAHYTFGDYSRVFQKVDGVVANGFRYGAFTEQRVEQYLGTNGLFDTGTFQSFDACGRDGDISNFVDWNAAPIFPVVGDEGAFYATTR